MELGFFYTWLLWVEYIELHVWVWFYLIFLFIRTLWREFSAKLIWMVNWGSMYVKWNCIHNIVTPRIYLVLLTWVKSFSAINCVSDIVILSDTLSGKVFIQTYNNHNKNFAIPLNIKFVSGILVLAFSFRTPLSE